MSCGDEIPIVSEKCKLKTRTHMGKLAARFCDGTKADTVSESWSDCLKTLSQWPCTLQKPSWQSLKKVIPDVFPL